MKNSLLKVVLIMLFLTLGYQRFEANSNSDKFELKLISENSELERSESQFSEFIQDMGGELTSHPELIKYVKEVGHKLAAVSDRPDLPYEFVVVSSSIPNASCLAGGKIIITRGMLQTISSEAELAAVLGHEIGHATARHQAKRVEYSYLFGMFGDSFGARVFFMLHDRHAEYEADRLGIKYMALAGYDTRGAIRTQKALTQNTRSHHRHISDLFRTHPLPFERMEAVLKETKKYAKGGKNGKKEYTEMTKVLFVKGSHSRLGPGLYGIESKTT